MTAPVGTLISIKPEFKGFTMLEYDTAAVAADGSTIIEIFYDREYHLMNFLLDGGYGVEPVYARYDTDFKLSTPSKAGYIFGGWEIVTSDSPLNYDQLTIAEGIAYDLEQGNTVAIPDFDITFKAKWIKAEATYNVVYWKENANDDGYSYWGTVTQNANSGDVITFDPNASAFDISQLPFSSKKVQEAVAQNGKYSAIPARYEYEFSL